VIGLDTNILVRYLAQDHPAQCVVVNALLEQRLSESDPGYVSLVALSEAAWVLLRTYKADRESVADGFLNLFLSRKITFQESPAVYAGLRALKDGTMDFHDAMIRYLGQKTGCDTTLTFDKRAARHDGFTLLRE
jgi:predicted nucleic-acid-binding protein